MLLVHGGARAADRRDLTVAELACFEPELRVLAVAAALPTGSIPWRPMWTTPDSAMSSLSDIVPGIITKLGAARVREMVLLAAFVPPQGSSIVDALRGPLASLARSARFIHRSFPMPKAAARLAFCNGMTRDARARAHTLMKLMGDESMTASQRYVTAAGTETRSAAARNALHALIPNGVTVADRRSLRDR